MTRISRETAHVGWTNKAAPLTNTEIDNNWFDLYDSIESNIDALSSLPTISGPTNEVIVENSGDFPTAVAGVITLDSTKYYEVRGIVSIGSDRIVTNGASIYGRNFVTDGITSTTGGILLTISSVSIETRCLTYTCTSGTFLDFEGDGTQFVLLNDCQVACSEFGDLDKVGLFEFTKSVANCSTSGMTFTGTPASIVNAITMDRTLFTGLAGAGTYMTFGTSKFQLTTLTNIRSSLGNGQVFISAQASAGNFVDRINVINGDFLLTGTGAVLAGGITVQDVNSNFISNKGLEDSKSLAVQYITGTSETTIAVEDTPVKISGTWTTEVAQRFTNDSEGGSTHNGSDPERFDITSTLTAQIAGGANKICNFYLAVDDVVNVSSKTQITLDASIPTPVTVSSNLNLANGEKVTVFVENTEGTQNLTVLVGNLIVG